MTLASDDGGSKAYWHASGKPIAPTEWASARALREGETSLNELIDIEAFDGRRMKERVQILGGNIEVSSEPRRGTRIRISFPSPTHDEQEHDHDQ
jgi:hypothetical protein